MTPDLAKAIRSKWLEELRAALRGAESNLGHGRHLNAPWRASWIKEYTEKCVILKARIAYLEFDEDDT